MKVRLKTREFRAKRGDLGTENEVIKVVDHIQGWQQKEFDL
jgi:hypothetical protein